jgi:hypothetical protein
VSDWNIQRLVFAQKQLIEILPEQHHLGLLSDETSKFGRKYEGFHVSDPEGRLYVLGMRDIVAKIWTRLLKFIPAGAWRFTRCYLQCHK